MLFQQHWPLPGSIDNSWMILRLETFGSKEQPKRRKKGIGRTYITNGILAQQHNAYVVLTLIQGRPVRSWRRCVMGVLCKVEFGALTHRICVHSIAGVFSVPKKTTCVVFDRPLVSLNPPVECQWERSHTHTLSVNLWRRRRRRTMREIISETHQKAECVSHTCEEPP